MSRSLRSRLVDAARQLLDEGAEDLDLRKVAERAGKSRTAPYVAFGKTAEGGGLEALRIAVAVSGFRDLICELNAVRAEGDEPDDVLRRVARAYLDFAAYQAPLYRIMFGQDVARGIERRGPGPGHEEIERLLDVRIEAGDLIEDVVDACAAGGAALPASAEDTALSAWAALHGAAMLLIDGQLKIAGKLNLEKTVSLILSPVAGQSLGRLARAAVAFAQAEAARDVVSEPVRRLQEARPVADDPTKFSIAGDLFGSSGLLRRLRRNRDVFDGARILWIDDQPDLSALEEEVMERLGADVVRASSADEAVGLRGEVDGPGAASFELILSDITRDGGPTAGVDELPRVTEAYPDTPVIFYVGSVDESGGVPESSFGIADRPAPLMHLVLDVLERVRS